MPIYEYECNACGERHEFIQKFSDSPKRKCPSCGKSRLRKLVSAAAFHLKGAGWYVTDFRDKDKKKAGGDAKGDSSADSKAAPTSDAKGDSSADSKAPTKADSKTDSKADAKPAKKDAKKGGGRASSSP
jgi:putative FmdB family regulatory protein